MLQRHLSDGLKRWWEHKLIPLWYNTSRAHMCMREKQENIFHWSRRIFGECHNFLWHGRCLTGLSEADEHSSVLMLGSEFGEIPSHPKCAIRWSAFAEIALQSASREPQAEELWKIFAAAASNNLKDFYHLTKLYSYKNIALGPSDNGNKSS